MLKKILIFTFIILNSSLIAQTETPPNENNIYSEYVNDSAYQATYSKLKELYIRKINSPTYLKSRSLIKSYSKKWKGAYTGPAEVFVKDPGMLSWLKDNWQKTEFTSYEEAEKEYRKVYASLLEDTIANPEFESLMIKAIMKYGPWIYTKVFEEIYHDYPDKF